MSDRPDKQCETGWRHLPGWHKRVVGPRTVFVVILVLGTAVVLFSVGKRARPTAPRSPHSGASSMPMAAPQPTSTPSPAALTGISQPGKMTAVALKMASAAMIGASWTLRHLPLTLRYLPADAVTTVVARFWRRRAIARNYAAVLRRSCADREVALCARRSVRNFGRMAVDFLASCTMGREAILRWVRPTGEDNLREALAAGRGVIFAMPHLGSWDVAAAFTAAYGLAVTVVVEDHALAQLVDGARRYQNQGVMLVPRERSLRPLFQALARNSAVVLLSDVAPGSVTTVSVPFFGRPARFPDGPARLALRTGAPILVLYCVRQAGGGYRIEALPPIWPDRRPPESDAICALTSAVAAGFERVIAQYPAHWYPFHPIWDDVPE